MWGNLSETDIDAVLRQNVVGRVGCYAQGKTYVVPVGYAYLDGAVYSYSAEGQKIRMMRENPEVCFEVDLVATLANWRSVICWGRYEELHGDEARRAVQLIKRRFSDLTVQETNGLVHGQRAAGASAAHPIPSDAVLYRIRVTEKTGRYEQV